MELRSKPKKIQNRLRKDVDMIQKIPEIDPEGITRKEETKIRSRKEPKDSEYIMKILKIQKKKRKTQKKLKKDPETI